MKIEVSLGEMVDRVSILRLKRERIADSDKRDHVKRELDGLERAWSAEWNEPVEELSEWGELSQVNARLWDVEDSLRAHETAADFGERFVALARSVYQLNDRRAALKRAISVRLGSRLIEEKSYRDE